MVLEETLGKSKPTIAIHPQSIHFSTCLIEALTFMGCIQKMVKK
jgi:hypothetical protein